MLSLSRQFIIAARLSSTLFVAPLALTAVAVSCGKDSTGPNVGKPALVLIVSGDVQSATVGTELPTVVVVRVTDDQGNAIPGQLVNFRVVSGGGSVFAGSSITNDQGEARERWTLGTKTADEQKLEARAVDPATGAAIIFATFHATALAGPAAAIKKASADSGQGVAGGAPATPPAVGLVDQYDNPVSGAPVVFAVASGGGSINGGDHATVPTNANGIATVSGWTLGPQVGPNTLTATASGLTGSPISFLATSLHGPVASITVTPADISTVSYSQQLTAVMKDANGNAITDLNPAWSSSNGSVAAVDDQGLVTLASEGSASITATSNGQTGSATIRALPWTFSVVDPALTSGCGLVTSGQAYCWGHNDTGQLGDGTRTDHLAPVSVTGVNFFSQISSRDYSTCGLTPSGSVYCWGLNNGSSANGDYATNPTPVQSASAFKALSVGARSACALDSSGSAFCWGYNLGGGLGDGTTTGRPAPVPVQGGISFAQISAGDHSCGVANGGAGYCWGYNYNGQLGVGDTAQRTTPTPVPGGIAFAAIDVAATSRTCGLATDGQAYCWGVNTYGQNGDGTVQNTNLPTRVLGGLTFVALAVGDFHTCGLKGTGEVYCWGDNEFGQLGDGTTTNEGAPVAVRGGLLFKSISADELSTCGVTQGDIAYCWGDNRYGAGGDGTTEPRLTPKPVRRP